VTTFLFAAAVLVVASTGVGLLRLLRGPTAADRMMAAQLSGTGAATACLLLSIALESGPIVDVAVTLAILAAIAAAALSLRAPGTRDPEP
jgi:multicomponent Na+:H+ antiporter subunit F